MWRTLVKRHEHEKGTYLCSYGREDGLTAGAVRQCFTVAVGQAHREYTCLNIVLLFDFCLHRFELGLCAANQDNVHLAFRKLGI